jgi:AraC-like DNA-binding protein
MRTQLQPLGSTHTHDLPPRQRIEFWEAHNASHLIGLRCFTHAEEGLQAWENHYDLGAVKITEIRGNEHVIERSREMLSTHPKDSIFACILLEGEAFFFQNQACVPVHAGDVIIYSTDTPYLYGFTQNMRQLIVECGASELLDSSYSRQPHKMIKIARAGGIDGQMAIALKSSVISFMHEPYIDLVDSVAHSCRSVLHYSVTRQHLDARSAQRWDDRRLQAEAYILKNLQQSGLNASSVAAAMGISVRHLTRLFENSRCSPAEWIWQQRLGAAQQELQAQDRRRVVLGDLAHRWGFSSPSHFSRAFKKHYGMTPSEFADLQQAA